MAIAWLVLAGCGSQAGSSSSGTADAAVEECSAFVTAYQQCLTSLGSPEIAAARVAQLRDALAQQASLDPVVTRKTCVDNLADLRRSCR